MLTSDREFNNIKVHTQYSICEGAIKIDELADYCKSKKIKAWRYHKRNSQKIVLIDGKCKVVLINKKKN